MFDFGAQESYTYSKGQSQDVLFDFIPAADAAYRQSEFTFKYMRQGSTMYESGHPINAGTYNVTISRPADNTYAKFEQTYTAVITINKAVRNLGVVPVNVVDNPNTRQGVAVEYISA